jgi:hypothetical protein
MARDILQAVTVKLVALLHIVTRQILLPLVEILISKK